jgi:hypothetical protein
MVRFPESDQQPVPSVINFQKAFGHLAAHLGQKGVQVLSVQEHVVPKTGGLIRATIEINGYPVDKVQKLLTGEINVKPGRLISARPNHPLEESDCLMLSGVGRDARTSFFRVAHALKQSPLYYEYPAARETVRADLL